MKIRGFLCFLRLDIRIRYFMDVVLDIGLSEGIISIKQWSGDQCTLGF